MSTAPIAAVGPSSTKFNPWPWAIVAFFVIVVSSVVGVIVMAVRNGNELVAPDYYDQEIRFQKRVDQQIRTRTWESEITARYLSESGSVKVSLPVQHAALGPTGSIGFYRPAAAVADREIPLSVDAKGAQTVPVRDWTPGLWKVRLHWKVGGEEFFAERRVVFRSLSPGR